LLEWVIISDMLSMLQGNLSITRCPKELAGRVQPTSISRALYDFCQPLWCQGLVPFSHTRW
jgi:hypothetical protein